MQGSGIRANPDARLPARARREFGIIRDVRLSWMLTGRAVARMPLLLLACATIWGAARYAGVLGFHQTRFRHGGTTPIGAGVASPFAPLVDASLLMLMLILGPMLLLVLLMARQHRMILGAPAAPWRQAIARGFRLVPAVAGLMLLPALAAGICLALPAAMLPSLGPVSAILLFLLLLPIPVTAALSSLRWSIGLPGISLGLRWSLAEGWEASRGRVVRSLAVCLGGFLPLIAYHLIWLGLPFDPLGWVPTIVHPVAETLAASLAAAQTGLLYRVYRSPAAPRPGERPSRDRARRLEPVLAGGDQVEEGWVGRAVPPRPPVIRLGED